LSHYIRDPRDLPSFPTRRSSDLSAISIAATASRGGRPMWIVCRPANAGGTWFQNFGNDCQSGAVGGTNSIGTANGSAIGRIHARSEEHTSELQSRSDLVCRLLLE